jgi:hypothetical protein
MCKGDCESIPTGTKWVPIWLTYNAHQFCTYLSEYSVSQMKHIICNSIGLIGMFWRRKIPLYIKILYLLWVPSYGNIWPIDVLVGWYINVCKYWIVSLCSHQIDSGDRWGVSDPLQIGMFNYNWMSVRDFNYFKYEYLIFYMDV